MTRAIEIELRDVTALLERAEKFAEAQEVLAANAKEDSRHWHHVMLANLLREMATVIRDDRFAQYNKAGA